MNKRQVLNQRMIGQLKNMTGAALKFYEYDIDQLLAMSDDELRRTLLDYLARYARDEIYHEPIHNIRTKPLP